jgi:hypothetical protein
MNAHKKPDVDELLWDDPVDRYGLSRWRWGYDEQRVYEVDGIYWLLGVRVTTGDEGRTEPLGEPIQVKKQPVTSYKWAMVDENGK